MTSVYLLLFLVLTAIPELVGINIVFDMNGVLSYQYRPIVCYNIGPCTIAQYLFYNGRSQISHIFMDSLHTIAYEGYDTVFATDDIGNHLPAIMKGWLAGEISGCHLRYLINYHVNNERFSSLHYSQQAFIRATADALFTPELFSMATLLHAEAIDFVLLCKRRGYKLYILSNWDKESFAYVRRKYAHFFTLFDGIIISGEVHLIKPDVAIYERLLTVFSLNPEETIFIDDQLINLEGAQRSKIFTIHCQQVCGYTYNKPDFAQVLQRLNEWVGLRMPIACPTF